MFVYMYIVLLSGRIDVSFDGKISSCLIASSCQFFNHDHHVHRARKYQHGLLEQLNKEESCELQLMRAYFSPGEAKALVTWWI